MAQSASQQQLPWFLQRILAVRARMYLNNNKMTIRAMGATLNFMASCDWSKELSPFPASTIYGLYYTLNPAEPLSALGSNHTNSRSKSHQL